MTVHKPRAATGALLTGLQLVGDLEVSYSVEYPVTLTKSVMWFVNNVEDSLNYINVTENGRELDGET